MATDLLKHQVFPRADLLEYISLHYQPHQIYLAAAGGVDHAELVKLAEKHFGDMQTTHVSEVEYPPARYTGSHVSHKCKTVVELCFQLCS